MSYFKSVSLNGVALLQYMGMDRDGKPLVSPNPKMFPPGPHPPQLRASCKMSSG